MLASSPLQCIHTLDLSIGPTQNIVLAQLKAQASRWRGCQVERSMCLCAVASGRGAAKHVMTTVGWK